MRRPVPYAAASVAAKTIFWIGVGLGLFLLPEAARRSQAGADGSSVLLRTLGIVAVIALPMVALYSAAGRPLLEGVLGPRLGMASDALPWLGGAMSLLACAYLCVQYLLAVQSRIFLVALGAIALVQPFVLVAAGSSLTTVAVALAGLQALLLSAVLAMSFRRGRWSRAPEPEAIRTSVAEPRHAAPLKIGLTPPRNPAVVHGDMQRTDVSPTPMTCSTRPRRWRRTTSSTPTSRCARRWSARAGRGGWTACATPASWPGRRRLSSIPSAASATSRCYAPMTATATASIRWSSIPRGTGFCGRPWNGRSIRCRGAIPSPAPIPSARRSCTPGAR